MMISRHPCLFMAEHDAVFWAVLDPEDETFM